MKLGPGDVLIVCDDPSHPRPQPVIVLAADGTLRGSHRMMDRRGGLWDDQTADQKSAADPALKLAVTDPSHRVVYDLTCRRCKGRPMSVRAEKLVRAVADVRRVGQSSLTLTQLAAILALLPRSSDPRTSDGPEAGQR